MWDSMYMEEINFIQDYMESISIIYLAVCLAVIICMLCKIYIQADNSKRKKSNESSSEMHDRSNSNRSKDDLRHNLDWVSSMISNCDQKSSILLGIIGILITIVLSSDFIDKIRSIIIVPFVEYCNGKSEMTFSGERFTVFILFFIVIATIVWSCSYLIRAISANIDYDGMVKKNSSLSKQSFLFFGSIAKMQYEEFKNFDIDLKEDLLSQIYVNSQIATSKFINYSMGLNLFKVLAVSSLMLFIAMLFI